MKFYVINKIKTSFVCSFKLYTGESVNIKSIVKILMEGYYNQKHKLYIYDVYNSLDLCLEIRNISVFCCGTMRVFWVNLISIKNYTKNNE